MRTLWATVAMMLVTTALIFGIPQLFESEPEMETIAMEVDRLPHEGTVGGDAMAEPAPAPWRGLAMGFLDHIQEVFWGLVQAFLVARYVKKRG